MTPFAYGVVILAGGNSSRLGHPKALLPYRGQTLLEHAAAAAAGMEPPFWCIVTGAHDAEIRAALPQLVGRMRYNADWREGMSASLRTGLAALRERSPQALGVLFLACDQPFVSARLLLEMAQAGEAPGKSIVACAYNGTLGIPALFASCHYAALDALTGEKGAKSVILADPDAVATLPFPEGGIDIDTIKSYRELIGNRKC